MMQYRVELETWLCNWPRGDSLAVQHADSLRSYTEKSQSLVTFEGKDQIMMTRLRRPRFCSVGWDPVDPVDWSPKVSC